MRKLVRTLTELSKCQPACSDGCQHQLLDNGLLKILCSSGAHRPAETVCGPWKQGTPARVVAVSSELHRRGDLDLADLHYKQRQYGGMASYGKPCLPMMKCLSHASVRVQTRPGLLDMHGSPFCPTSCFSILAS